MRALAAWLDAGRLLEHLPGRHDQKAHGRRFKTPGDRASGLREPKPSRPTLSDMVLGTAMRGPKRQRPTGTVTSAIADAERLSDTTGRPTKPDAPRPEVAAAAADIRDTVDSLVPRGEWLGLADLRDALGTRYDRSTVDDALRWIARGDNNSGMQIEEETNQKTLRQRDRGAAVRIGSRDQHVISVNPNQTSGTGPPQRRGTAQSAAVERLRALSDADLFAALQNASGDERQLIVAEIVRRETA